MHKLSVLIFFVFLLSSCRKEPDTLMDSIEENTEKSAWERFDYFNGYQNVVLNSHSDSVDRLIFLTQSSFSYYNPVTNGILHYYSVSNQDHRFPISDNFHIESFLSHPFDFKLVSHTPIYSKILQFDTIVDMVSIGHPFILSPTRNFISINKSQNQVVFPICKDTNMSQAQFYDIKLVNFTFSSGITIDSVLNSRIYSNNYPVYCQYMESYFDKYFIGTPYGFYLLYPDGTNRLLFEGNSLGVHKVVSMDGILYAFSDFQIYESTDQGENWNIKYISGSSLGYAKYFTVNDSTLVYSTSYNLYRMFFNSNGFTSKKIILDGFGNYTITSLSEFKDSIYVTTLSGVYRRLKKDFYEYE